MQNTVKSKDVRRVDLTVAAEARLAAAALAVGGYVVEPSLEQLLTAAAALLNRADAMLEPSNMIYDRLPRAN